MKDLWVVASYTIKDMLKKKTFIISNLIIFIIIIVGFNIPNILNMFKGEENSEGGSLPRTLIVDEKNIFEGSLDALNELETGEQYEIKNENMPLEEVKNKIVNGDVDDAIIISKNEEDGKINIQYIVENMAMMENAVPERITNMLTRATCKHYTTI